MSSDSDVRMTSHDRHDPMLVAALAAGDLAGTDRDQAISLTRTCSECRALHDDLLALARATASVPPPIASRPRDFQLTPADAARLRPMGWRRLLGLSAPRPRLARQAGFAFTTLGLVGLLVGNVSLPVGSAPESTSSAAGAADAALPSSAKAALEPMPPMVATDSASDQAGISQPGPAGPAASSQTEFGPADSGYLMGAASSAPRGYGDQSGAPVRAAAGGHTPAPTVATERSRNQLAESTAALNSDLVRPLNFLFIAAVAIGLILLVASRIGRPRRA